jgi:hypothetical protein
MRIGM